jgi:K+-transporting ATPase ATPase C chain
MASVLSSLRLAAATWLVCVVGYTASILAFAQIVTPETANGSLLVRADGTVVGSRLVAQAFTQPQWFWPRPSAVAHDAAGAGGSNESPAGQTLAERARKTIAIHGATTDRPLPADLAATSGSGLDPHITEAAALHQVERVAAARGTSPSALTALVHRHAFAPGGIFTTGRVVNVLELNLALAR